MRLAIICLLVVMMITTSCKKFLEEVPKDEIASGQYFTQPDHAVNAVNALYRTGAPQLYESNLSAYSGSRMMIGPYMSGYIDNEFKGQEIHVQYAQNLTLNGTNLSSYLQSIWSSIYNGIARSNNAIKYIPVTPGVTEEQSKRLSAEAKFFRAYAYFQLVRMFGGVPLITEPYENQENLEVARSTIEEVYNLITADLESAVNEGGLPNVAMINNGGRITKGAVSTLLADVYLTMSGYPLEKDMSVKAALNARSVITSNVYRLTAHNRNGNGVVDLTNTAYNKLRLADNSADEYIYYYEYAEGIATSAYSAWAFPATAAADTKFAVTVNTYAPTPKFFQGYNQTEDLRAQEKQLFHSSLTRSNGTVLNFARAPYIWQDDKASFSTASSGKDLPIYTYSDPLLIGAEAIALSEGVTTEAVDYLSQVKERAYWKADLATIKLQLSQLSKDDFIKEVWKERYRELVFEGRIWFDIQRTRLFPVPVGDASGNILFEPVIGHVNNAGAVIQEKNLLFPIATDELQRNASLIQNPGY
ncbi:RagB/SusD family nutrient uptake outer membrane protein [Arcticibacter eurypsychrophilus]|uniref:RagB/SusD family nutrient uptake outer membrane protein n=1 Tax=Arcticibacter eurypsychrophilus TaxID=1434752 RepID=UPI00084D48B6|nr:RagB/SusD family nutrient uptake outer membrane protein [Arcticibacter eurypsychrophilus]